MDSTAVLRRSSPTYLYLKGNLYYFRYAFPKALRDLLGHTEIRISLKTGYVREARHSDLRPHAKYFRFPHLPADVSRVIFS
ncbi:DUF6538 domain-containing protein [Desulfolutivibrio sulfodismutans]|uniref:DUF6538 domain-containing protein n=1 Tax=Desulfolutivibrio sulfodismutans TaxID=63561 RepID=UPI0034A2677B